MKASKTVNVPSVIKQAFRYINGHWITLILLSLINGALSGLFLYPVYSTFQNLSFTVNDGYIEVAKLLEPHLIFLYIAATLINSFLLIIIIRKITHTGTSQKGFTPWATRILSVFLRQIFAAIFSLCLMVIISEITSMFIEPKVGNIANLTLPIPGILALYFLSTLIYTIVHIAILNDSRDLRSTLLGAWQQVKPYFFTLMVIFMVLTIASVLLGNILHSIVNPLVVDFGLTWLPTMINQSLVFVVQILHIGSCLWVSQQVMSQRNESVLNN